MSVPTAYLGVILIWSTTPLAIKWSSEGPGFLFAATSRMIIGALLCVLLAKVLGMRIHWHKSARQTYLAASLGIYGAMLTIYWGAQYIPSGFIAVLFGLSPIVTSVLAAYFLDEGRLTIQKLSGLLLGLLGLAFIFRSSLQFGENALWGVAAILAAVIMQAGSAIWIKHIDSRLPALTVVGGGLIAVLPLYFATWWIFDGTLPETVEFRAGAAIFYLGIFGSVLGFVLYFYILKHLRVSTIALVTLVTPIAALIAGESFNNEVINNEVWLGTLAIASGLVLHQWSGYRSSRRNDQELTTLDDPP
ncbi:MAG: EamA family transporter [Gammaproteobacteria bacterium]|nr:MAG: EamA family transporter [Gammaproteobacteria bacterium]